jgi:hypothetical protein
MGKPMTETPDTVINGEFVQNVLNIFCLGGIVMRIVTEFGVSSDSTGSFSQNVPT